MTPAANHLLRALYLHAMAPSTANQDAVRAAGAALDTETARGLNAPRSPTPPDSIVAEVRADLLARSERGIAEYGCTLDRKDLGLREWMEHAYHEGLDRDLYLKRAIRELDAAAAASVEPPHAAGPDLAAIRAEARREALLDALAAVERVPLCYCGTALDYLSAVRDLFYRDYAAHRAAPVEPPHAAGPGRVSKAINGANSAVRREQAPLHQALVHYSAAVAAPVEPPHAAAPVLRPLTPEPAEAALGRAGEALAWDGRQPPVWVEFEPGVRHPYGDAAFHVAAHVTPDGKARLFPSKAAANVWLVANGTVPV